MATDRVSHSISYIELTSTRPSDVFPEEATPGLKIPPIGQIPPPLVRVDSMWNIWPWYIRQGKQIVRFDLAGLLNFKALITISKTFILER
jgi:hypothetical protein